MPPDIAAFFHVNVVSCATENNDAPDRCAVTERFIHIFLQWHNAAPAIRSVGCDDCDCAAIGNAISNAVGTKSAEDH